MHPTNGMKNESSIAPGSLLKFCDATVLKNVLGSEFFRHINQAAATDGSPVILMFVGTKKSPCAVNRSLTLVLCQTQYLFLHKEKMVMSRLVTSYPTRFVGEEYNKYDEITRNKEMDLCRKKSIINFDLSLNRFVIR